MCSVLKTKVIMLRRVFLTRSAYMRKINHGRGIRRNGLIFLVRIAIHPLLSTALYGLKSCPSGYAIFSISRAFRRLLFRWSIPPPNHNEDWSNLAN
jgi:hypothetical protein